MTSGRIRLQVRSRDNATLGHHEEQESSEGTFSFDAISLKVAGQEYGKSYFLLVYWVNGDTAVTLWRADYSRLQLGGPIELLCDLDRHEMQGPPCRFVGDASDQPWMMAAGAQDFRDLCASCHGDDARGSERAGKSGPFPDLTKIAARRDGVFPGDEVAEWIDGRNITSDAPAAHGTREMPVWGIRLQEQTLPGARADERIRNRIDILVAYLDQLQER